ncbi:MAG: sialidase family protein [Ginsengibacter sp.]
MKHHILLILICTGFTFQSCFNKHKQINIIASNAAQIDTSEGSCPYLTKDNKGNIALSWIRKIDSSVSIYCYSISADNGKSFGKAIEIPGSNNIHPHGENMPKIIFKPDGEIIAAWASANPNAKNAYSDVVYYSRSDDKGATWSKADKLVSDTTGYDQRYFDMAILPDGNAAIIWLDNRKKTTGEGSALYFAETGGNSGFENERLISEPCCPCCRTDLFVDSKKNIHVVYRAILHDSIRDMVHSVSNDMGKTFSEYEKISNDNWVINGCPHTGPAMTENKDGIQFTWFTGGDDAGIFYCSSNNNGQTFSKRDMVSGIASRHCQITSVDNDIAIVWNEHFSTGNHSSSLIGIEVRNADGRDPVKKFITPETGNATFPVIKSIDRNSAFVSYTETVKDRTYVKYKIVSL